MFDHLLDRILTYRLGLVHDCWGNRRAIHTGTHNGLWFIDVGGLDAPPTASTDAAAETSREQRLAEFEASGLFTDVEISTLRALVVARLTIDEIAGRDGCSRQAVMARLVGNSRGQGGILKKARKFMDDLSRRLPTH